MRQANTSTMLRVVTLAIILEIVVVTPILAKPTETHVQPSSVTDLDQDPGQTRVEKSCNESQWKEIRTKQLPACLDSLKPRIWDLTFVEVLLYVGFPVDQIMAALCNILWKQVRYFACLTYQNLGLADSTNYF